MKEIAVDGLTLTPQGIVAANTGTLTITSLPSTKVKAEGKGVYSQQLQFTLVGANATGYDPGTVVTVTPGIVLPLSTKTLASNFPVLRVDDTTTVPVSMTGTISGTPTPFIEVWKITDAGQTKVLAN